MITGHGPFAYHQSLICPEIVAKCRYCENERRETFFHLFTECPQFNNYRMSSLGVFQIESNPVEWNPKQLLDFVDGTAIGDVFRLVEGVDPGSLGQTSEDSESLSGTGSY